jgi:hypothetical protein
MNRLLTIPAGFCLVAFAALLAGLHGATGRETAAGRVPLVATSRPVATATSGRSLQSPASAERALTALAGEYIRPWRERAASPYRLYSRAAPRPIPSISADVQLVEHNGRSSDAFLLASIVINTGDSSHPVPCVVDRATNQVQLFADGKWLAAEDWLATARMP